MLFGTAALIGGTIIAPKFQQRMGRVERMHDTRARVYLERQLETATDAPEADSPPIVSNEKRPLTVNTDSLLIFIAVVLIGGGACGRWWEIRHTLPLEP